MRRLWAAFISVVSVVWGMGLPAAGQVALEEEVVGPAYSQGTIYTLSPRGMRLATVHMKGSRWVVSLDGVEGPPFDQILPAAEITRVEVSGDGMTRTPVHVWSGPVAFSPDGSRYAYAARIGEEAVVMLDGKEIWRAPFSETAQPKSMAFTPDGKHLYFTTQTLDRGVAVSQGGLGVEAEGHLIVDGQPGPPSSGKPTLFFSPDGAHWGYIGNDRQKNNEPFLVINGKPVDYAGERPQFTPDGRVVCIGRDGQSGEYLLLLSGKPILKAHRIDNVTISPSGDIAAVAVVGDKSMLYINGKAVPGTENAGGSPGSLGLHGSSVMFSPDGNRWALHCSDLPRSRAWVVVDGAKQREYNATAHLAFSPDSSKCIYVADMSGMKFVVVNGEEEEGNQQLAIPPIFAGGNHYAYVAGQYAAVKVYHDGKAQSPTSNVIGLTMSPDGTRIAYYGASTALQSALIVDGEAKGGAGGQGGGAILFSPDSKHIVAMAQSPNDRNASIYIDGDYVAPPQGAQYLRLAGFTPDSQHLIMESTEAAPNGGPLRSFYVDGERVLQLSGMAVTIPRQPGPADVVKAWEARDDGSIVFIGSDSSGTNYGPIKRFHVKPPAGEGVAGMVSRYKSATADAEAAKQAAAEKKAADEQAARDKAAADREAALKKAAEERQAALEARQKAMEERRAAQQKAQAERQAAREKAAAEKK
jgi:hypothetical protein